MIEEKAGRRQVSKDTKRERKQKQKGRGKGTVTKGGKSITDTSPELSSSLFPTAQHPYP